MKRFFSIALVLGIAVFTLPSFILIGDYPQDPPRTKKTEKHIKMVKVDDNGKKMELDTLLTSDEPFIWEGDTIGGGKTMHWITKDDFEMDSMHMIPDMQFNYNIEDDGEGNVVIMKSGKGGKHMIMTPGVPLPPPVPDMMFKRHAKRNVIDLSDPGIISYNKKIQKDGTEKITIVRKQVNDEEFETMEDVMVAPHGNDAFFYSNAPKHSKTVKVIKSDDGTFKVYEDDKVIEVTGEDGEATFTGDEGEEIHIKEIKEGEGKKVEVKVEKKVEKENK